MAWLVARATKFMAGVFTRYGVHERPQLTRCAPKWHDASREELG
jgi:hypothetical protein